MLTAYKRCEIYPRKTEAKSHLFFDTSSDSYVFSEVKSEPRHKLGYNVVIYILSGNTIIASSDDRTKIPQVSKNFQEKLVKKRKDKYCSVKRIDDVLFVDENNQIDIDFLDNNISIQEIIEIANAYPDNEDLGRYIRQEIINT